MRTSKLRSFCEMATTKFAFALHLSIDNGENWIAVNSGLPTGFPVKALAINSSGHILAGIYAGGFFRSTNNGESWTRARNNDLVDAPPISALAINSSGHLFLGIYSHGIFRSTNNGDDWAQVNTGLTNNLVTSLAINDSGHIFTAYFNKIRLAAEEPRVFANL